MKTAHRQITTLTIVSFLLALIVTSLPAQRGWNDDRRRQGPPEDQRQGLGPLTLSTNTDGQFAHFMERLHEEMTTFGEKRQAIAEHGAQVRRLSNSDDPADVEAVADHLAEMHRIAEEMHGVWAERRESFADEMLPLIPEIIAEIDAELSTVEEDAPSTHMLQRIRAGMVEWQENPEAMPGMRRWGERNARFMERLHEDNAGTTHWLVRRLERLERRQTELVTELERLEQQISGVQEMVNGLSPEELAAMEEPEAREPMRPQGRNRGRF